MREKYDWVDRTLFILFSYAHITDWELADSERSLIQSKTRYIFKLIVFIFRYIISLIFLLS